MPSSPTILAFDTSAAHVAAALFLRGSMVVRVEEMKRRQGERLFPLLEEILSGERVEWRALDSLAVCTGPGNFTGIRISVSAARGLALGLKIPAYGVSVFEAVALALNSPANVAIPAPQERVFLADPKRPEAATLVSSDGLPREVSRLDQTSAAERIDALARIGAARWQEGATHEPPKPLYIKPADAAPPKDAPPVLID
ncbi:MAG: tRNA (adenosine(37)-N6)-threonylcarbamoyltransferase complex dimerization subunit type 1 TsaB [Pseudomonadota bacterium]